MQTQALITKQYLTDIANAIRQKASTQKTYLPEEMAAAILELRLAIETTVESLYQQSASVYNVVAESMGVVTPVDAPSALNSHAMPIRFERTAARKT